MMRTGSVRRALKRQARDFVLNSVVASVNFPRGVRSRALSALGVDVGRATINGRVFLGGTNVSIGRDAFINYDVFIDNAAPVMIGDRVSIGPRVTILTGSHGIGPSDRRAGVPEAAGVRIEEGAWIGACATIMPGVTVGRGSIVAAGAVVLDDVPADVLVAGVPARLRRSIDEDARDK